MISKGCKYAIRAAVFIAAQADTGKKFGVKEIAEEIEAPPAFTAKILQILNKHKIVTSLKGPYGGFYCEAYQLDLPVIDIVNAIDGKAVFNECVMGLQRCSNEHPCPMHDHYAEIRNDLQLSFEQLTLRTLASDLTCGDVFLKN